MRQPRLDMSHARLSGMAEADVPDRFGAWQGWAAEAGCTPIRVSVRSTSVGWGCCGGSACCVSFAPGNPGVAPVDGAVSCGQTVARTQVQPAGPLARVEDACRRAALLADAQQYAGRAVIWARTCCSVGEAGADGSAPTSTRACLSSLSRLMRSTVLPGLLGWAGQDTAYNRTRARFKSVEAGLAPFPGAGAGVGSGPYRRWIVDEEGREAEHRRSITARPPVPDWLIEQSIGQHALPVYVRVGGCHMAGKRSKGVARGAGGAGARGRRGSVPALLARHRPRHAGLTADRRGVESVRLPL